MTIVVTNHNYGRFLGTAIESALAQGEDVQVVVVDDGSTDDSGVVIASYGGRITPVLLDRRGQKEAFNRGLSHATGDIVVFLDADDVLGGGLGDVLVRTFADDPRTARVIFRLGVIDEFGRPTGAVVPDEQLDLPSGDVRRRVLWFADDLAWPPTSGNAFAVQALRTVMPLPVDDDPTGADHDLHALTPLLGPVVALEGVRGWYRVHGMNAHARRGYDPARSAVILRRTERSHRALDTLSRRLGCGPARPRSVTIAAHRLVLLRLNRIDDRPVATAIAIAIATANGIRASVGRFDVSLARRAAYCTWFVLVAVSPRRWVTRLADRRLISIRRSRVAASGCRA